MTNDTYVKSSMSPRAYKVVRTHAHEISVWTILSRLLHSRANKIGGMNGDVQSDLATLAFKNREQLEDFHSSIIIPQQEIVLSRENLSREHNFFPESENPAMKIFKLFSIIEGQGG